MNDTSKHAPPQPTGPLRGVRVVEFAGLGPVSFTAMLLADMGARVVRIERPGAMEMERGATMRGRERLALDLRSTEGLATARELLRHADVAIEGFRPGVMERLGLGPAELVALRPALVFGRMTGWGQEGPRSRQAGHDIDYLAVAGGLHPIGPAEGPIVPLNLVGDYGGGALYLAVGVLAALHEAMRSGRGQVVDAAICDGCVSLLSLIHGLRAASRWRDERQSNTLDGAAPYYRSYRCADGLHLAVGAIEPQFHAEFCTRLGLDLKAFAQSDRARWPEQARALEQLFAGEPRRHWEALFEGSDACVAPVHSLAESTRDPHLVARGTFVELEGELQPAPAPRFSHSPAVPRPAMPVMADAQWLADWARPADLGS
ncbi:CaiB/BaiF CoA transferase family protein [Xenophilus azovorans]|uniref:CaiB/BaiF CoA transferase family protein n=1 Tax=Xenophilus azovorans TaxID=151755 RepID=UPI00068DFF99|nr:CaiB/BaiF CoA-transferase family protein [Xenophilus azovorans]